MRVAGRNDPIRRFLPSFYNGACRLSYFPVTATAARGAALLPGALLYGQPHDCPSKSRHESLICCCSRAEACDRA
jgi:hypothetical protein